ncbi:MAG TPA: SAM-dependent chlorinase/fluorinase [Myxococcaceae bacterium]|nr:SAM-dependent chlorinase/fluorinase [Myxococcaceae bacterium]
MRIVTLLTDFGLEDGYVAAMKGVIAGIAPEARLVDITHLVPPQDVAFGRFRLLTVAPYFPPGTVHLAVVDPGVGTARRAVAVRTRSGSFLVGPDNGLLTGALEVDPATAAVELSDPRFWRTAEPSATFHGRDIFSPVAAHLARGATLESMGSALPAGQLVKLDLAPWERIPGGAQGAIQAVDRFGNLISNVPGALLPEHGEWTASIAGRSVGGHRTYGDVPANEALALVGSHGFVEIAVHRGDARRILGAGVGDRVQIRWRGDPPGRS